MFSELLETVLIVFRVLLNFDPVKEILKIRFQIYILMKKVIILRKIQAKRKTFTPPFFNHFSLSLNRKKGDNESHEEGTTEAVVRRNSSK